ARRSISSRVSSGCLTRKSAATVENPSRRTATGNTSSRASNRRARRASPPRERATRASSGSGASASVRPIASGLTIRVPDSPSGGPPHREQEWRRRNNEGEKSPTGRRAGQHAMLSGDHDMEHEDDEEEEQVAAADGRSQIPKGIVPSCLLLDRRGLRPRPPKGGQAHEDEQGIRRNEGDDDPGQD